MNESYTLKDGRQFLEERQAEIFSTIMKEHPHYSTEYRWDELSLGELFAKCYKPYCRYCPEVKEWFAFKSTHWVRDIGSVMVSGYMKEFTNLLNIYCSELPEEEDENKPSGKEYKKFVTKLGDRRVRDRVLRDAQDDATISIDKFDSNPYLINCQNGTYDLEEGSLRPHNPNDYITMITNCYYPLPSQRLEFPRWAEFINEITCGQKDVARYLQRALGYSLYGVAKEECMFIAYGKTTRNGKGTLFNTIYQVLGDYAGSVPPKFICADRFDRSSTTQANPLLAGLRGKRFITLSEPDDMDKLNEATIKSYTGNDPITARNLYERTFTYTPQFKMWLSCNTLPSVTDRSLFSSDRVRVIEFNKHFGEDERDTTLKSQFLEEDAKAVIFKWLIDGYISYHLHGLPAPVSIASAMEAYREENDRVGLFVEERCETSDENARIGRGELYTAYKSWCTSNGLRYMNAQRFKREMERFSRPIILHGVYMWKGITLKALGGIKIKGVDKKSYGEMSRG